MKPVFAMITMAYAAFLMLVSAARADPPPTGCYDRIYDSADLAAHPEQVVRRLTLYLFVHPETGGLEGRLYAVSADQGHVRGTGMENRFFSALLVCDGGDGRACQVQMDGGGSLRIVSADQGALVFETRRLAVELGGVDYIDGIDLAEQPEQLTRYRLFKVADMNCAS